MLKPVTVLATAFLACGAAAAQAQPPAPPAASASATAARDEGFPIDNDVVPIRQSLGAWTAAEQGAVFARNIIAEHSSNPRMLIVHEVMGRHCGWLAAATAREHHTWVQQQEFAGWLENDPRRWDVHGVYVPERPFAS